MRVSSIKLKRVLIGKDNIQIADKQCRKKYFNDVKLIAVWLLIKINWGLATDKFVNDVCGCGQK